MNQLHIVKLGTAFGIAWAFFTMLAGLTSALWGWGVEFIELLGTVYAGYGPTLAGSLVGAVWGFANGFLWGAIIAWIYNKLL